MAKEIERYLEELKSSAGVMNFRSLKDEISKLDHSSKIFENFERESATIGKGMLHQIEDLSLLAKMRKLASRIKEKSKISGRLKALHSSLAGGQTDDIFRVFLHNGDTKIDSMIMELNDFKAKIAEMERHHSVLLPKSLDNRLMIDGKYGKYIESLHSVHKKQKDVFAAAIKLFLKSARKHIGNLQKFKKKGQKHK